MARGRAALRRARRREPIGRGATGAASGTRRGRGRLRRLRHHRAGGRLGRLRGRRPRGARSPSSSTACPTPPKKPGDAARPRGEPAARLRQRPVQAPHGARAQGRRRGDRPRERRAARAPPCDAEQHGPPRRRRDAARSARAGSSPTLRLRRARAPGAGEGRQARADARRALARRPRRSTPSRPPRGTSSACSRRAPARRRRSEVVVVGAHYDHLGRGGPRLARARRRTPSTPAPTTTPPAPRCCSRSRAASPRSRAAPDRSVLFLAFGAEEIGAIGSRYWVEHPTVPLDRVVAMINADMVGRLRDDRLIVDGVGTSAGWRPLVDAAAQGLGFDLAFGAEGFGASDHASFTAVRVPVAFFFTGVARRLPPAQRHRRQDQRRRRGARRHARRPPRARRGRGARAARLRRRARRSAPRHARRLQGLARHDPGLRASPARACGSTACAPTRPPRAPGSPRGDVIVKVGPHDIGNIHDYMFALGELEPGREVVIEVERDGKRVPLEGRPRARAVSRRCAPTSASPSSRCSPRR